MFALYIVQKKYKNLGGKCVKGHGIIGWRTKFHTIDCARNTFLLLQKHLKPGTELILIGWKIVPNEEHVQCDHRFASQSLANEPLHSSQLFDASLQKARGTTSLQRRPGRPENVAQLRVRLQEIVRQNGGHIEHVLH